MVTSTTPASSGTAQRDFKPATIQALAKIGVSIQRATYMDSDPTRPYEPLTGYLLIDHNVADGGGSFTRTHAQVIEIATTGNGLPQWGE